MPLRYRRRVSLGPLRFNFSLRGLSSVSLKAGPFTWNPTRDRLTTNLPGGLYHEADLRPTGCRCGDAALMHDADTQGCTRCPCTRYRRSQ
jgi:hypothetical protein